MTLPQAIIRKKVVRKNGAVRRSYDAQKEALFKKLRECLEVAGYQVRREELKRGTGWRVMSGACRVFNQKLIFVDRRLTQDEQVEFLREQAISRGVSIEQEAQVEAA